MGNPSVRFDEGRERVGHWPFGLSIPPFLPTLRSDWGLPGSRGLAFIIGPAWLSSLAVSFHITHHNTKGNMKKTYMISVVAIALAGAFAVLAAEKNTAVQKLVRLKVDGKTVAELRVFEGGAVSLTGDKVNHVVETTTTIAKGATLQFGGASGKSITVKAEEMEVLPLNK